MQDALLDPYTLCPTRKKEMFFFLVFLIFLAFLIDLDPNVPIEIERAGGKPSTIYHLARG